jgi:hypothetical protein
MAGYGSFYRGSDIKWEKAGFLAFQANASPQISC